MSKGQRRNEFLLGTGDDSVVAKCTKAVNEFEKMAKTNACTLRHALALAYQRGVADAFDAEDGR